MSGAEEKRVEAEIADGEREKRVEAEIRGREREKRAGAEIAGGPGEMGLYIHIPFCRSRCHYCDFPSTAGLPRAEQLRYKEALLWEWAAYRRPWPAPVRTLYVGGGTPTYLAEDILTAILTAVLAGLDEFSPPGAGGASRGLGRERQDKLSPLGAAGLTEFTVEANPGAVTAAKLASLRRLGCDRLSLGAQSFDDRYLAWLGRGHRAADFFQAWRLAREAGFAALNLDLIYGLPGQSPDHWKRTLLTALGLAPEHISLYQLSVEAGTVLGARAAAGEQCGAAEEVCRQQYLLAHQSLTDAGFVHYEISNYARPGSESRHNTLYWRNG
ncbi:MAG: coproporphyrinogen III oxidase family protein [Peptococcaceae bacterium]|jgi:oxygen-independent coproporphyrinogen-3 oxidase|nr:coproporphyrinogen III oxidase family protein [Peptococcaceae bacterium]